ncbi:calcium-regulated heat-stable protein 1-like [Babylonia areolata]|uniref:calcium-regulated heat-stable protein 1-like n=1 Tax=Babylonia areolata TaxID=304850 RepID=UPI003FCF3400
MASPRDIPQVQAANNMAISGSPEAFHLVPTRRERTMSQCEKAKQSPLLRGLVKSFCRQRGHGFITPEDGTDDIFVHISDVDGEYVPKEGDEVTFHTLWMPPKMEKKQACHVVITHLTPGVTHERWDSPVPKE